MWYIVFVYIVRLYLFLLSILMLCPSCQCGGRDPGHCCLSLDPFGWSAQASRLESAHPGKIIDGLMSGIKEMHQLTNCYWAPIPADPRNLLSKMSGRGVEVSITLSANVL